MASDRETFYLEDEVDQGRASSDYITEGQIRETKRKGAPPIGAYPSQQYESIDIGPGGRYNNWWRENVQVPVNENTPEEFWRFLDENTLNQAIGKGATALGGAIFDRRVKSGVGGPVENVGFISQAELDPGQFRGLEGGENVFSQSVYGPENIHRSRSVAEAQARNEKYFYTESGVKKLAITAAQLEEFKKSSVYDPSSEKSALTQWANAMPLHMPAEEISVQEEVSLAPSRRDVFDMGGSDVRAILTKEEGFKLEPYGDAGHKAVGIGHKFEKGEKERSVSNAEARRLLEEDISGAYASVDRLIKKFDVEGSVPPALRDELMMMAFQMGATGLSRFKKMWKGIKNQDWNEVTVQMADSRWAKSQTPARAARTINRVKKLFGI